TSRQAKRGGIIQADVSADEPNLDPLSTARVNGGAWSQYSYSRPLQEKVTPGGTKAAEYEGDAAASWELATNGLRMVLKLRPDLKWDARAPTNGRAVDSDDVVFSWNKFVAQSPWAGTLANKADPNSAVISAEKIDSTTYAYNMAFP